MAQEQFPQDDIRSAQEFFSNLYLEMSGGPLESELETARLTLELNEHLSRLSEGGAEQPDGSKEATYEFLSQVGFVTAEDGELHVNQEDYVPQICRIQYAEDGFSVEGSTDPIKWIVGFEIAGNTQYQIYSTVYGQIGNLDSGIFEPASEYARGLVIVANNMVTPFNSQNMIQRIS